MNITGVRLEVLQDPSLPYNGPGLELGNGNFILSEFKLDATPAPEPASGALLLLGGCLLLCRNRQRS